jgi:hypothetical protein
MRLVFRPKAISQKKIPDFSGSTYIFETIDSILLKTKIHFFLFSACQSKKSTSVCRSASLPAGQLFA